MAKKITGVQVPGGIVTVDLRRGHGSVFIALKMAALGYLTRGASASGVYRDIVIIDSSGKRELYREGPYDAISVKNPLDRILREIREVGLDEFLHSRHVAKAGVGRLDVPSGQTGLARSEVQYLGVLAAVTRRRLRNRSNPPQ